MTDWIVDCPECGTHFRITASHLAAAGGLVRCGACHRVFRASERLRERTARQAVRTDPDRQQAERHRPVLGSSAERDDAVPPMPTADELDAAALAGRPRPGAGEGVAPEPVDPVTHDSEAAGALPFSNEPAGPDRDETLEAAADRDPAAEDALLGEDEFIAGLAEEGPFPRDAQDGAQDVEPHAAPDASVDGGDASLDERRDDGATGVEAGPFTLASGDELEQPSALAVEDALEAELDDLLGETPQAVGLSTPLQEAPASRTGGVLGLLESRPATLSERVVPEEAAAAEDADVRAAGGADADAQAAEATRIALALPELPSAPARAGARGRLAWSLVALLALAGLLAQVWRSELPRLAADPQSRPLAERLCALVGCALPELRDVGRIRSQRLVVRSHPERADALRVDAVILNRAPWDQPFPDIELRFSDLTGSTVALRRFHPDEYLGGEMAQVRTMPSGRPVQIALELIDPGEAAINYAMTFH